VRLRAVIHERADAARLIPREKVAHHAARGEDDGIVRVHVLRGRSVGRRIEASLAVRKIEGPAALRDRVPRGGLEETHDALRADLWSLRGHLARARPEHAEV